MKLYAEISMGTAVLIASTNSGRQKPLLLLQRELIFQQIIREIRLFLILLIALVLRIIIILLQLGLQQ